jgi:TELO2-interacting protein 1
MEGRNQVFQRLKPQCVALSQAALALTGPRGDVQTFADQLEQLHQALSKVASNPSSLDATLAEYIFFPVSQVLKASQRISVRCLELSLQIIGILVDQGWRQNIKPQLAAQIIILCTLMAERRPKGFSFSESTDELQTASFWCLSYVFSAVGESAESKGFLKSEGNFPQLGQTITTVLDGILDGRSVETQIAATSALDALVQGVADKEICASFLPGIVSKLTKVLTPSTSSRRSHRVLLTCLSILNTLLRKTMADDETIQDESKKQDKSIIDAAWKETAAAQLKPAITSILRLKNHGRDDVKEALARFCLMISKHCRKGLANCVSMAFDTLLSLAAQGTPESAIHIQLEMLLRSDSSFSGLLQTTMHDWLQSMPTMMQAADEQAKLLKVQQMQTAYGLLVDCSSDTGVLDRMLATTLRDSAVITLQDPKTQREGSNFAAPMLSFDKDLAILNSSNSSTNFGQPLVRYRGQEEVIRGIEDIAKQISNSASSPAFATELSKSLRFAQGEVQIATFWLLLTSTEVSLQRKDAISDFLDVPDEDRAVYKEYLEDLYAFALSVLTDNSDDPPDSRLQALALRTLALRAQTAGREFRYELIDALYPVLHTLTTPDDRLQADSITTLNIFTSSCGYSDVRELIVDNVDYLTNAVALKLNAFDASPQAPQVLLMMVRLAGPGLLPYLEDTVESIFAALEDYHGYSLLVEGLFRVLGVMAEEGVKAPQLAAIKDGKAEEVRELVKERWTLTRVGALAELLGERAREEKDATGQREKAPQRPWRDIDEVGGNNMKQGTSTEEDALDEMEDQVQQMSDEDPPPPAPKTYNLLFKITEFTQHYLPSASPSLRSSLLSLIRTTIPAIARHENSFLPLINTLWPEIVSRLDDAEPHVQATALELVGILCEHAGEFMRSRIVQLWPALLEICQKLAKDIVESSRMGTASTQQKPPQRSQTSTMALIPQTPAFKKAIVRMQSSPADYIDTLTRMLWDALINSLLKIVKAVPLPPEFFDEVLEMMEPVLEQREDVRRALERENADAVWLVRIRSGAVRVPQRPAVAHGLNDGVGWRFAGCVGKGT